MSSLLPESINESQFMAVFAPRDPAGHKGSFGCAAIIGGTSGMVGAAVLAARSALKAGTGRVYVGLAQETPGVSADFIQPELMWRSVPSLMSLADQMTAWGVGCGLGDSAFSLQCLRTVLSHRAGKPLVLDADALNAIARADISVTWGPGPVILTPHPAEAARLLQTDVTTIQANRLKAAQTLAKRFNAWVVLKGQHSLVCDPTGHCQTNLTGNVGLASAGTGDVLTGLLTGLLAQGFTPEVAVPAAVWMHGAAADEWVSRFGGPIGMTASELIDAIRSVRNRHASAN
jgi:hydroxyethylthiazole kinase-like uncharacterized protein yjeF